MKLFVSFVFGFSLAFVSSFWLSRMYLEYHISGMVAKIASANVESGEYVEEVKLAVYRNILSVSEEVEREINKSAPEYLESVFDLFNLYRKSIYLREDPNYIVTGIKEGAVKRIDSIEGMNAGSKN